MKVPFNDPRVANEAERRALLKVMERALDHGRLDPAAAAADLEARVAARLGRSFAVAVGSGTEALGLALAALGIGRGAEVVVSPVCPPPFLEAVRRARARTVFADASPDLTLDPASLAARIGPKTRAILAAHWTGRLSDMDGLLEMAGAHKLPLIEEAGAAFGAERMGHKAGGSGTLGCFDLGPCRPLGALGRAGLITTDDAALAERLRALRGESLPDALQAGILVQRLKRIDGIILCREENAHYYQESLKGVVEFAPTGDGERHLYDGFAILTDRRDRLKLYLDRRGIETRVPPLAIRRPAAARQARRWLAVPAGERLGKSQRIYVAETIRRFFRSKRL